MINDILYVLELVFRFFVISCVFVIYIWFCLAIWLSEFKDREMADEIYKKCFKWLE